MNPLRDDLNLVAGFQPAGLDDWHARVEQLLKGAGFEERLVTHTADGVRYAPLYTRLDGPPGAQPMPACGPGVSLRQPVSGADANTVNQMLREEMAGGTTSAVIRIREGGDGGLPPEAVGAALHGIALDQLEIVLDAGAAFRPAAEALMEVWRTAGIAAKDARGAINADPLGGLATNGGLAQTLDTALADVSQMFAATQDMANVTAAVADGRPYHNAGAGAALELALMLSTFVAYLRAGDAGGMAPEQVLGKIAIGLGAHADQLIVIAKLRAARRLIWRIGDATGAAEAALDVRLSVTTSWRMLTRYEAPSNILRATLAAAASAMGGADAITVLPHTAAIEPEASSSPFARRIARNTLNVLGREAQLARVADPAAGSYAIEHLTDDIARKAWSLFQEVEAAGGMAAALASGFVQDRLGAAAARRRNLIVTGRRAIAGISVYATAEDRPARAEAFPPADVPARPVVTSVRPLRFRRDAEPFEDLRDRAAAHKEVTGRAPTVFLACLGTRSDFAARASSVRNALSAAGFDVTGDDDGFTASGPVGFAFSQSGASLAVVASSDEVLGEIGEASAMALKSAGAAHILMAGKPEALARDLEVAGVDQFLPVGCDLVAALGGLLDKAGVQ